MFYNVTVGILNHYHAAVICVTAVIIDAVDEALGFHHLFGPRNCKTIGIDNVRDCSGAWNCAIGIWIVDDVFDDGRPKSTPWWPVARSTFQPGPVDTSLTRFQRLCIWNSVKED